MPFSIPLSFIPGQVAKSNSSYQIFSAREKHTLKIYPESAVNLLSVYNLSEVKLY